MIVILSIAEDIDPNYANALSKAVKNNLKFSAMIVNFPQKNKTQ